MYPPRVDGVILNEVKEPSTAQISRAAPSFSTSDRFSFAFSLADKLSHELPYCCGESAIFSLP
jgi:hypothetical protein